MNVSTLSAWAVPRFKYDDRASRHTALIRGRDGCGREQAVEGTMTRTRSPDPTDRMGVYKGLDGVPHESRLEQFRERYRDRDTYGTFLTDYLLEKYSSDRTREKYELAGRRWKAHIEQRGRHHALARPLDVETWIADLLDRVSLNTAYNTYWVKVERFYWWLQRHVDHPHSYHPVLMAAANLDCAGRVWEKKIGRGRETE